MAGVRREKAKLQTRCDELFLLCTRLSNSMVKLDGRCEEYKTKQMQRRIWNVVMSFFFGAGVSQAIFVKIYGSMQGETDEVDVEKNF